MTPCNTCGDSGWAIAFKEGQPLEEYAFICQACQAAQRRKIKPGGGAHPWTDEKIFDGWILKSIELPRRPDDGA